MIIVYCLICGKKKEVWESVIKNGGGKYCSRKCIAQAPRDYRRKGKIIICPICKKERYYPLCKFKYGEGKFCSQKCNAIQNGRNKKGIARTNEVKEKIRIGKLNSDYIYPSEVLEKMRGTNSPFWKGEDAKYGAKHDYVRKIRGTPNKCEDCGSTNKKRYYWANISKEYKRDPMDYKRLCGTCHIKFDKVIERRRLPMNWNPSKKSISL